MVTTFFSMFHTFIRGWDESEFPRLLHAVNRKFAISGKFATVRGHFPGTDVMIF
jgi:hypothetical protein